MRKDEIGDLASYADRLSNKGSSEIACRCLNHCFKAVSREYDTVWKDTTDWGGLLGTNGISHRHMDLCYESLPRPPTT